FVLVGCLLAIDLGNSSARAGQLPSWSYRTGFVSGDVPPRYGNEVAAVSNDDPRDFFRTVEYVDFKSIVGAPGGTLAPIVLGSTHLPEDLLVTTHQTQWGLDAAMNQFTLQLQIPDANQQSGIVRFGFDVWGGLTSDRFADGDGIHQNEAYLFYDLDSPKVQS